MARDRSNDDAERANAPTVDQARAAAPALDWKTVGKIAIVYSRSPTLGRCSLADIEWLILPAVQNGHFHVVEAADGHAEPRGPIAAATWAFVSPEIDARLSSDCSRRVGLRPDEWESGDIGWIVDWAGDPSGVASALAWLKAGPFRNRNAKIVVRDLSGRARVATLDEIAAASA